MTWSPGDETAGRLAFNSWRFRLPYLPVWDWGDMSPAERQEWVACARQGMAAPDRWPFRELHGAR